MTHDELVAKVVEVLREHSLYELVDDRHTLKLAQTIAAVVPQLEALDEERVRACLWPWDHGDGKTAVTLASKAICARFGVDKERERGLAVDAQLLHDELMETRNREAQLVTALQQWLSNWGGSIPHVAEAQLRAVYEREATS